MLYCNISSLKASREGAPLLRQTTRRLVHILRASRHERVYARESFTIANHMTELSEELLNYHRDEDYKIGSIHDDLISAVRYAFMDRRIGRLLSDCDAYGYAPGIGLFNVSGSSSSGPRIARDVDFDMF